MPGECPDMGWVHAFMGLNGFPEAAHHQCAHDDREQTMNIDFRFQGMPQVGVADQADHADADRERGQRPLQPRVLSRSALILLERERRWSSVHWSASGRRSLESRAADFAAQSKR